MHIPELLAPAGSLERLKVAVKYGADAVYVGGQRFGLRASADNFSDAELKAGVTFAHRYGVKVFVTLNAFLHDSDLDGLESYCNFLETIGVDAVIVSDAGVMSVIQRSSALKVHLSTQASCLNRYAGRAWKTLGVERLILGRESSIPEAQKIKQDTGLEVELFIHGALCMAYSGNCVISNYTAGRDSNRGGCIYSCRFGYNQTPVVGINSSKGKSKSVHSHFMSSKDLNGVFAIPLFIEHQIDSLKIEGRMKSPLYVATLTRSYRKAIDLCLENALSEDALTEIEAELRHMPHREYTSGSLVKSADASSVYLNNSQQPSSGSRRYLGLVLETLGSDMVVRLHEPISQGLKVEVMPFRGPVREYEIETIRNASGSQVSESRQDTVVYLPKPEGIEQYNLVRAA